MNSVERVENFVNEKLTLYGGIPETYNQVAQSISLIASTLEKYSMKNSLLSQS